MPGVTPLYGWPFQSLTDPPDGPNLGEDLAMAIENTLSGFASQLPGFTAVDISLDARLDIIEGAWTSYTPTLTNLTLGNATQVAKYRQVGKTVDIIWKFTLGNTSAVGTAPRISLPVGLDAHSDFTAGIPIAPFSGELHDQSTSAPAIVLASFPTAQAVDITYFSAITTQSNITATAPWTWTTSDQLSFWGSYYIP